MEETFPIQPLFPHLPERLAGLETLAENLWWSWNPAARMLFKTLELTLGFRHENLSNLIDTLENVASRATFGIIIAAMIVGSSMIISTGVRPLLFGFPALGVIGYLFSGLLGIWLLINIIRKRKY